MSVIRVAFPAYVFIGLGALICPSSSAAEDDRSITINCNGHDDNNSINKVLARLDPQQAQTIVVSGTCRENVVIQGYSQLTLKGNAGATITDPSGGVNDVVTIFDSREVTLQGFTINGGADGVACQDALCRLSGNTIQNSMGSGVIVSFSRLASMNDVIQGHQGSGVLALGGATASLNGDTIRNNPGDGVTVERHSFMRIIGCAVTNSGSVGIAVQDHSTAAISGATITGSGVSGVRVQQASEVSFPNGGLTPSAIHSNAGSGVELGDLCFGNFPLNGASITGNNTGHFPSTYDVTCKPQFSATRGALTHTGGTTNCVEP